MKILSFGQSCSLGSAHHVGSQVATQGATILFDTTSEKVESSTYFFQRSESITSISSIISKNNHALSFVPCPYSDLQSVANFTLCFLLIQLVILTVKFKILVISMELSIKSKAFPKAKEDNTIGNPVPISFFNSAVNHSYNSMFCIFIYIFSFGTRARSSQQREPITVSLYYLTPLSTFLWEETGVPGENPRLSAEC